MQLPTLAIRYCERPGCRRTWRAPQCSTWNYCSRHCAIDDGTLRKNQDFRDFISMTFVETAHTAKQKKRGIF